jgi:hypothetical protein
MSCRECLPVLGFAFACGSGTVHLFERETNDKYTKRNMFLIPEPEFQTTDMEDLNIVQSLSISPEENQLLATTMRPQMFSVRLWDLNMTQVQLKSNSVIVSQY